MAGGERFSGFRPGARGGARGRAQSAPRRANRFVCVYYDVLEGFRTFSKVADGSARHCGRVVVVALPQQHRRDLSNPTETSRTTGKAGGDGAAPQASAGGSGMVRGVPGNVLDA